MHVKPVEAERDWIDDLLIAKARIHMIRFDLEDFKREYRSLYHTIRAMMYDAKNKK